MTHDLQNRPYARLSELSAGSLVDLDEHFDCMSQRTGVVLHFDQTENGLYFTCNHGAHFIDEQLDDDDDDHLIGIYHHRSAPTVTA